MIVPVILCGGSGTRLWPLSRELYPKQFAQVFGEKTLFQLTLERLANLPQISAPIIVTNNEHRFLVAEQLRQLAIEPHAIILEPVGRNTAPAVALAAFYTEQTLGGEHSLLVLPADHLIADTARFQQAVNTLYPYTKKQHLATFGITPTEANTGYGYVQSGEAIDPSQAIYHVKQFVEKPSQAVAQRYIDEGNFAWNSGMFLFRADTYLNELEKFEPAIHEYTQTALANHQQDLNFIQINQQAFEQCPAQSIDYGVMEKTQAAITLSLQAGWSDVGAWSAILEATPGDANNNSLVGDVVTYDCESCYIRAESRLVTGVGLQDMIVVESKDAVLIVPRSRTQEVKQIVDQLREQDREEVKSHQEVFRPWGAYESIAQGHRYQTKRILVHPGESLSLQLHHHRAEHWIVVKGRAHVVCGDKSFFLDENESTYIPIGSKHRLSNPGKIDLELIEVQSGAYLGEDDIVRFEDQYGRTPESETDQNHSK